MESLVIGSSVTIRRSSLAGRLKRKLSQFYNEFVHNIRQFVDVSRRIGLGKSTQLMLVKLIDYSDHLPVSILPTSKVLPCRESQSKKLRNSIHKAAGTIHLTDSQADEHNDILEVSYCASRGSADSHPHVIHAHIEIQETGKVLVCRYFDDESTVWLTNIWRASTVTVAEVVIALDPQEVTSLRYYRYRSPKREKFARTTVFQRLHSQLQECRSFPADLSTQITFGVVISKTMTCLISRFPGPALPAQLLITEAILTEIVDLVALGFQDEAKLSKGSGAIRRTRGRKQLRTTKIKRNIFLSKRGELK